jgi:ATP-binding cassette subfamily B (MDR/TAP) protein 1
LLAGVGIAFYYGADFAAVCAAFLPIIMILTGIFGAQVRKMTKKKMVVVKKLGGTIEEILTAIRLIASYANENIEAEKFKKLAEAVRDISHDQEFWLALTIGVFKFVIFLYYVYSIYIASIYLEKGYGNPSDHYKRYETGTLLTVFISFMTGMLMIFGLTPNIQALIKARVVGKEIFDVIDRVPEIKDHDKCSNDFEIKNHIIFKDLSFRYPTQPAHVRNVLDGMNFKIRAGETTAIVGPSGSGKSTIVQMIERFYSPLAGEIFFDDVNIKDITLKALRENIGYVS